MSLLAVPAETGPKTVKELIERAKAAPGKLNYGAGTITAQLMGVQFHKAAGLDIVYVPFKGTAETVNGLLTGSVDLIYGATVMVGPLIAGGKVRALAKLDSRKDPYPELPTLAAAADLPNLDDMAVWLGLVAPKATPKADHRQAQQGSGAHSLAARRAREIRPDRQLRRQQHAGGVRSLHPQGGGALAKGAQGSNIKYD